MAQEQKTTGVPVRTHARGRWLLGGGALALALAVLAIVQPGLAARDSLALTTAAAPAQDTDDAPAAPDTVPPEDATAIADYWQERDAAFADGATEGMRFVASSLHPALGYSPDGCLAAWFPGGVPDDLRQQVTADLDSVTPAPDWRMPYGPLHDTELAAPVYRVEVRTVLTGLRSGVDVDRTVAVHLAVVEGRARGFAACVEPTVARAIINELAPAADPTIVTGEPIPAPPAEPATVEPRPADAWPAEPWPAEPWPDEPSPADAPPTRPAPPADPVIPPSPGEELTVEEELRAVLQLMDALLQSGDLAVAEAIDLLAELAAAPELDAAQRALVQENLRLLREADPDAAPPRLLSETTPTGEWSPGPPPSWDATPRVAKVTYGGCTLADGAAHARYTIELTGATGYHLSAALHTADGDRHRGGLIGDHNDPVLTEWEEVFSGSRAGSFTVPSFGALALQPFGVSTPVMVELDDEHRTTAGAADCDLGD